MNRFKKLVYAELPFFFSIPALLWQIFFLYIPLLIIFYYGINGSVSYFAPTLIYYKQLFYWPFVRIIVRSILLASATAIIALLIAYPVVYYIVFHARRIKRQLIALIMIPFWINVLVLAYSWFFLLERNGLINTFLIKLGIITEPLHFLYTISATLTVMVYCYLPFMIMSLYASLEKLDERLLEASADLGANTWQTFFRITVPLSVPGIKTGLLLVFVPAFGEFALPTLLGGSKFLVVGSLISYYFFVARNNGLGAAFTIVAGIVLFTFILVIQKIITFYARFRKVRE